MHAHTRGPCTFTYMQTLESKSALIRFSSLIIQWFPNPIQSLFNDDDHRKGDEWVGGRNLRFSYCMSLRGLSTDKRYVVLMMLCKTQTHRHRSRLLEQSVEIHHLIHVTQKYTLEWMNVTEDRCQTTSEEFCSNFHEIFDIWNQLVYKWFNFHITSNKTKTKHVLVFFKRGYLKSLVWQDDITYVSII